MKIQVIHSLGEVGADEWDALVAPDDPFTEHRFLWALEESGSVGEGTGWLPRHVLVRREGDGALVGAMPCYLRSDSYGEFVFDWAWANAAARNGIGYYPKLTCAVPFTPVTGGRLLSDARLSEVEAGEVRRALLAGVHELADDEGASSIHVLFCREGEVAVCGEAKLMPRIGFQFHWHNEGYATFDDFVGALRAKSRTQVRKERREAVESGIEVRAVLGSELDDADWRALKLFYRINNARHGSSGYLTPAFFDIARETMPERVFATIAMRGGERVAGTLGFVKGEALYGRYWGAQEEVEFLHFEMCYYQYIAWAIAHGMGRFEAGAQGEHKLKRGLLPNVTHSAHWLRHRGLAEAVGRFLVEEARETRAVMEHYAAMTPFKRDGS